MDPTDIVARYAAANPGSSNIIPIAIFGACIGLMIIVCLVQTVRILLR